MKSRKLKSRNEKIYDTLRYSDWFKKECEKVKQQYEESLQDDAYLNREVKRLAKYLPSYWEQRIREYILTGKLELPTLDGSQIVLKQNLQTGEDELYLRIFKKTTMDDVKSNWEEVQRYQRHLTEIWSPEISDIDLLILRVWDEVEARPNKPEIVSREVSAVLRNEYNYDFSESDLRKRISRLRKQLHADKLPLLK